MPPDRSVCPQCDLELFAPDVTCPRCAGRPRPGSEADFIARTIPYVASSLRPDDRYEVLETLGRGGMGIVYQVRDRELDEVIALKVFDPLFGAAAAAVERFKREIKIARRINHPTVARVYDLVTWRGRLAISMEYIGGLSLEQVLATGPLPPLTIRRYLRYLCSGLHAAHRIQVVHRDLKPGNILIDTEDRAHLLDFGISLLKGAPSADAPDQVFGTASYMSPEQAFHPEQVDHRSDIYSLGVVLYKMATGELPFSGGKPRDIFFAHLHDKPRPPSRLNPELPGGLERVILRCLEKDPGARFASARDVFRSLEEARELDPVRHGRAEVPPVALVPGKRGKVLVVDDDALARAMVCDLLRENEVIVLEAKDGYEGVERALAERPDLILLDLIMPVLDGREALRILKSNRNVAPIPVVMLTSLSDPEEAVYSKEMGAAAFLNKPVERDVLELLVERYAGERRAPSRT